jgi:CDP-diacylglycerol--glycerol-3-phosphate 3-phosphatidyltransferase
VSTGRLNLPNSLTILRLLLVPVLGVTLTSSGPWHDQVSAAVYAAAAATDTLDGQIARRRKLVTDLGKFLDPLADKLLVITVLAILVSADVLAFWVFVVILAREFVITGLRLIAAQQGVVIGASPWGKSKTLTQNLMIMLLILSRPYPQIHAVAMAGVGLAVVATVLSGVDYLWRYRHFVI